MEILLGIQIKVVMLFALIEELLLHAILASLQILFHLELFSPEIVHHINISLEKVFGHCVCYIFNNPTIIM